MKKKIYFKVVFYLIMLIAICGWLSLNTKNGIGIGAVKGYKDLTDFHFQKDIAILNGQWEYTLSNVHKDKEAVSYVNLPSEWDKPAETKKVGEAGRYRLHIKVPEKGMYMFHLNCIPCFYRLYINGELIGEAGQIGDDVKESQLIWNANNFVCELDCTDVLVELVTSNFYYNSIGHVYGILFGTYDTMSRTYVVGVIRSVILIGMFSGFGIYLLMLYEPGSKRKSYLYLGIFGLSVAFLELLIDLYLFQYFWTNSNLNLCKQLNLFLFSLCCVSYSLYEQESQVKKKKLTDYIVNTINVIYLLLIVIFGYKMYSVLNKIYIPVFLLNMAYPFVFTIRDVWMKKKYSILNICSYIVIVAASLKDMMAGPEKHVTFSYSGTYIVGILFFLLCQMYILAQKNIDEFHQSCEKKDMEIAFLQAQIAPHFFFNTLNNIYCMMDTAQDKAKSILMDFCDFLRVKYKFDYRTEVYYTLLEEVDMVAAFVRIENERYNHKILFQQHIEECCKGIQIPPLLLQPIVENAIKHGMTSENLIIHLNAVKKGDMVEVVVQDNGKGMGMDQVHKIMSHQVNSTGIGLDNINSRLKKCFRTRLIVESSIGKGTIVKLYIPIRGRG